MKFTQVAKFPKEQITKTELLKINHGSYFEQWLLYEICKTITSAVIMFSAIDIKSINHVYKF